MSIIPIQLPKPEGLQTYLDEQGKNQVFYWPLVIDETYSFKPWNIYLQGDYDWAKYGFAPTTGSTGTLTYDSADSALVVTETDGQLMQIEPTSWKTNYVYSELMNSKFAGCTIEFTAKVTIPGVSWTQISVKLPNGFINLCLYKDSIVCNTTTILTNFETSTYHKYTLVILPNTSDNIASADLYVDGEYLANTSITLGGGGGTLYIQCHANSTTYFKYFKVGYHQYKPILTTNVDYDIEIDTAASFDTANKRTYKFSELTGTTYNDGYIFGFIDFIKDRQLDSAYTFYWRVKVNSEAYYSDWSDTKTFILAQNTKDSIFQRILNSVLDGNVYTKDYASGNIPALLKGEASEVSVADFEIIRNVADLSFAETRDSKAGTIAGLLFGVDKASFEDNALFRNFLNEASASFVNGTTSGSVQTLIKSIVGVTPEIREQRHLVGWQIYDDYTTDDINRFHLKDNNYIGLQYIARLFSSSGKAFTWQLHVFNPHGITYNRTMVEELVNKLKPAHTQVYFIYYNDEGAVLLNPYYYGEAYYGEALYTDKRAAL